MIAFAVMVSRSTTHLPCLFQITRLVHGLSAFSILRASKSIRRISMKNITGVFLLLLACAGCTVLSVAGTAVSTTASVVGTVVETGVGVAGSAIKGVANTISGPDDKRQQ